MAIYLFGEYTGDILAERIKCQYIFLRENTGNILV